MTWRKAAVLGLVFGFSGLAYAVWKLREEKKEREVRQRIATLAHEVIEDWCTCRKDHECEGHRA